MPLGHHLPRAPEPTLLSPEFSEVTAATVALPELSQVPLSDAWMGHPGWQCGLAPSAVIAGSWIWELQICLCHPWGGGLRSLSWKAGPLPGMGGWGGAAGVQSSIRDLWAFSSRVSLLSSCLAKMEFQNSVSLLRSDPS